MSDKKNSAVKTVMIVVILLAVAGIAYTVLNKKPDFTDTAAPVAPVTETAPQPEAAPSSPAATPAPETASETPAAPAAEPPAVVVETKTLDLPAAPAPQIPTTEASKDPAVESMMGIRKLGSDTAPIKVVEYSSLTCGHCSDFHKTDFPKLKAEYIDTGKVQFIFKEFPLNKPAVDASKILRCMPEDKYIAFQDLLFSEQGKWAYAPDYLASLKQNAKLAGLSEEQIDACLNNKDLENRIIGDMKAGSEKYKVESTPTFIVNDGAKTIVGHQPITFFEETFNGILTGKTAPASDEKK